MLIIPIILTLIVTSVITLAAVKIIDIYDVKYFGENNDKLFYNSIKKTNALVNKWSQSSISSGQIKADISSFNEKYKNEKVSIVIYQGKELVYPLLPVASNLVLDTALSQGGSHTFIMDNMAVYKESMDRYSILLIDSNFGEHNSEDYTARLSYLINLGIIVIPIIIAIIIITYRVLTRFIYKNIIKLVDIQLYGMHQIRDDNLNYHIEYEGKD